MTDTNGRRPAVASTRAWTCVLPACPDQVRHARRFFAPLLDGCPVADDAVLCLSELASNSVLHSESRHPGGTLTVRTEIHQDKFVFVEVRDDGGPWQERPRADGYPHGLAIVRELATAFGVDGDAQTGWIAWARLDWRDADSPLPAAAGAPPAPSR